MANDLARSREEAVERAGKHSPFLREAAIQRPELVSVFLDKGADAAIALALAEGDGPISVELRRQRLSLALATALGDLAGELALEAVTLALSDFADRAIDAALRAAVAERVPDARRAQVAAVAVRGAQAESGAARRTVLPGASLPHRP